ncbi:MAG: GGDEF domain-containing protein [Deltaproteobacteria bacterium]|nr:GGDEF domain-containing protein [Deltaproteobacteria bacterium]
MDASLGPRGRRRGYWGHDGFTSERSGVECHCTERNDGHRGVPDLGPRQLGLVGRKPRREPLAGPAETEAGRARRHGPRGALFFIDLNDFKNVNDEHGHAAGDQVLREVALRLQDAVRSSDLVGRIGGDEFALIVEGIESQRDVASLAEKVAQTIEVPIELGGITVNVGASIGVAFFPDHECHFGDRITLPSIPVSAGITRGEVDHESVRRLLEKADAAMYAAKRKGLQYWIHEHLADETLRGTTARVSEPPPAA